MQKAIHIFIEHYKFAMNTYFLNRNEKLLKKACLLNLQYCEY